MLVQASARCSPSCFQTILFAVLWLGIGSCPLGWAIQPLRISACSQNAPTPIHWVYFSEDCAERNLALSADGRTAPVRDWSMGADAFAETELLSETPVVFLPHDSGLGPETELGESSADADDESTSDGVGIDLDHLDLAAIQMPSTASQPPRASVKWGSLMGASTMYLGVMHSFRIATEPSTRAALHNSVFGGYFKALGAMHGWSDGDGYYENYLGHPIQGAVSAYMWIHNDPRYSGVEFGGSRDYWMSRLRAIGYAWAFSEQFEVGLTSEASIGQIQRYCCAYGFVDHVITPAGAVVWLVGGDILDRYVARPIEARTSNTVLRALLLTSLNFPQGFANLMAFHYPWHRENRAGIHEYSGQLFTRQPTQAELNPSALPTIPKVEIVASMPSIIRYGDLSCAGGTGVAAFRLSDSWQWTAEVGGCKLTGLHKGWSGDSLTFLTGPQWVMRTGSRWTPHAHVRFGGQKITEDYCLEYGEIGHMLKPARPCKTDPSGYPEHYEATGPSFSIGTGVDLQLNRALEVRVAQFDYIHSWLPLVHRTDFSQGARFTLGIGLKIGTW